MPRTPEDEARDRIDAQLAAAGWVVAANLKRADRLRQAVLKWVFEGVFVPQDPSDEQAGVLLESIRGDGGRAGPGRGGKGEVRPSLSFRP